MPVGASNRSGVGQPFCVGNPVKGFRFRRQFFHLAFERQHLFGVGQQQAAHGGGVGKQHRDVLRAIDNLLPGVGEDFGLRNFAQGFEISDLANGCGFRHYQMTRDGFALLAMGFTGKKALSFKVAYIEAFAAMEQCIKVQLPSKLRPNVASPPLHELQAFRLYES